MTTYYKKNSVSPFILALECLALFLPDINNHNFRHNVTIFICIVYSNCVEHALIDSKIKSCSLCSAERYPIVSILVENASPMPNLPATD